MLVQSKYNFFMENKISHRIKVLRDNLGLSQEAFSSPAGLQLHQLSKYERGEVNPTTEILLKLGKAHHINLHWLLTGEGQPFIAPARDNTGPIEITSADSLGTVASSIFSAYAQIHSKGTATASWIQNLVAALSLLLSLRKETPRRRKLWRSATQITDTLMHDLKSSLPGDPSKEVEGRLREAMEDLDSRERVDAQYAGKIARCFDLVTREFAYLEYSRKYTFPPDKLDEIKALLEPWCYWVVRAGSSSCPPLEVNPAMFEIKTDAKQENLADLYFDDKRSLVSIDGYTKDGRNDFMCGFKFLQGRVIIPCGAVGLFALVNGLGKLAGNAKTGLVDSGTWTLFKDYDVPAFSITKDGTRIFLDKDDFEQFIELANALWSRDDVKKTVIRKVLQDCGAL